MNDAVQRHAEPVNTFIDGASDVIAQAAQLITDGQAIYRRVIADPAAQRTARELAIHGIRLAQLTSAAETLAATAFIIGPKAPAPHAKELAPPPRARHRAARPRPQWLNPVQGWIAVPAVAAAAAAQHAGHAHRIAAVMAFGRRLARTHRLIAASAAAMTAGVATAGTIALSVTPAPFVSAQAGVPVAATVQPAPSSATPAHRPSRRRHGRKHVPGSTAPVTVTIQPPHHHASTTPSASPDPGGQLAVSPPVIPPGSPVQVTLTATGGPVQWAASPAAGVSFSAYAGTVAPGQPETLIVTVAGPGIIRLHAGPGPGRGTAMLTVTQG